MNKLKHGSENTSSNLGTCGRIILIPILDKHSVKAWFYSNGLV